MRPQPAGPTIVARRFAPALILAAAAIAVFAAVPSFRALRAKETARASDRTVGFAVDLDDIRAFVPDGDRPFFLDELRRVPVSVAVVRESIDPSVEADLRSRGFRLLWRLEDGADSRSFASRIGPGDGVLVAGEYAVESPGMAESIAGALRRQNGFLSILEFAPVRPLLHLPLLVPDRLVRTHIIPGRETVWPKPGLWEPRIRRAVRDRWVRLVCVRFSSSWSPGKNVAFLTSVGASVVADGFVLGPPRPIPSWPAPIPRAGVVALALAVLAPAAIAAAFSRSRARGAIVSFTAATAVSTLAGMIVHGLVTSPLAAAGVSAARGIKLQLVAPLLLSAAVLVRPSELAAFFRRRVTWGALALAGCFLGGGLALYMMRSGNQPLLPVTDAERIFRDGLEQLLGARPRFKEFAIGHPLLVAGLYLRGRGKGFFADGRALVLLGMIGQVSVINTFVHAPAPLAQSLLRTFNGWWVGGVVAIVLCHFLGKIPAFRST